MSSPPLPASYRPQYPHLSGGKRGRSPQDVYGSDAAKRARPAASGVYGSAVREDAAVAAAAKALAMVSPPLSMPPLEMPSPLSMSPSPYIPSQDLDWDDGSVVGEEPEDGKGERKHPVAAKKASWMRAGKPYVFPAAAEAAKVGNTPTTLVIRDAEVVTPMIVHIPVPAFAVSSATLTVHYVDHTFRTQGSNALSGLSGRDRALYRPRLEVQVVPASEDVLFYRAGPHVTISSKDQRASQLVRFGDTRTATVDITPTVQKMTGGGLTLLFSVSRPLPLILTGFHLHEAISLTLRVRATAGSTVERHYAVAITRSAAKSKWGALHKEAEKARADVPPPASLPASMPASLPASMPASAPPASAASAASAGRAAPGR